MPTSACSVRSESMALRSRLRKGLRSACLALAAGAFSASGATADHDAALKTVEEIAFPDTVYPVPADAYFAAPDGKADNSGRSPDSPWPAEKALASAPDGGTVVFRGGGPYRMEGLFVTRRLILQPYQKEKVWFKGSLVVTQWVADGSAWRHDGWSYKFPVRKRTPGCSVNHPDCLLRPDFPLAANTDMVYLDGKHLVQVAQKSQVQPGKFFVDTVGKKLYIGDNPAGKTVEATAYRNALSLKKDGQRDPTGAVVRGMGFAHYADNGVYLEAPRVILEKNVFSWNGLQGVQANGHGGNTNDCILRGNTFSFNGRLGLRASHTDRMLLEGNHFYGNNIEYFWEHWDAAALKLTKADGMIIRDNLVERNFSNGIWLDIDMTNSIIVGNRAIHNRHYGIFLEISHAAVIAGNFAVGNSVGIRLSGSSSAKVYNNTLVSNTTNINIMDNDRVNPDAVQAKAGSDWEDRNLVIKNNLLSNAKEYMLHSIQHPCGTVGAPCKDDEAMVAALDYNIYYRADASMPAGAFFWKPTARSVQTIMGGMLEFRQKTGFEQHGLAIDNVAVNPFFMDQAKEDYRLKSQSPARGRGEPLPQDVAIALGWKAGVAVDAGAFQFDEGVSANFAMQRAPRTGASPGNDRMEVYGISGRHLGSRPGAGQAAEKRLYRPRSGQ